MKLLEVEIRADSRWYHHPWVIRKPKGLRGLLLCKTDFEDFLANLTDEELHPVRVKAIWIVAYDRAAAGRVLATVTKRRLKLKIGRETWRDSRLDDVLAPLAGKQLWLECWYALRKRTYPTYGESVWNAPYA